MTVCKKGVTLVEVLLLTAIVLICAAILTPMLAGSTNCGGNSAAQTACRDISVSLRAIALAHEDQVSLADLTPRERDYFRHVTGLSWLPDSRILVAPGPITIRDGQPKAIVAVCDHPFDNVPRRFIGKAPLTHAVAYSDGSTGLMSVEKFHRSDFSKFVDVTTIARKGLEPDAAANQSQPVAPGTNLTSAAAGSGR
jgi:type II secretory pathway pseudopilin PulG